MTVNRQVYKIRVEPQWTLYYFLHDVLGFTGAKQMCDHGICGSCTVIADGHAILSCMTLAIECDGKNIETVEGIAAAITRLSKSMSSTIACSAAIAHPDLWLRPRRCSMKIRPLVRKRL